MINLAHIERILEYTIERIIERTIVYTIERIIKIDLYNRIRIRECIIKVA